METIKWERPVPFTDIQLPQFPVDALPSRVRPYVEAVAESTQTPVDMAGSAALAIMASCLQGKYRVRAKTDWSEPTNLYTLIIAEPGERKSAIMNLMTKPLRLFEDEYNNQHAIDIEQNRIKKRALEKRQRAIEEKYSKGEADICALETIAYEISRYKESAPLQIYVDDITPEKLVSVMADHDGIASVISAEGGIFDQLAGGMYSKVVNLDVFLKGHAGDSIRVDRIGRASENIQSPALTLLLAIQPKVLSGLMNNDTFRGRGLMSRFLYTKPVSLVGNRIYRTDPITEDAKEQYYSLIRDLLDVHINPTTDTPEIITLTNEADHMLEAVTNELEPKLISDYIDICDWANKLCGAIVRMSGILCRADMCEHYRFAENSGSLVVDDTRMQNAITLGKYFVEHARAAYRLMGADPIISQSKYVLTAIKNARQSVLTKRDIMRLCRSIKRADELQLVLDRLVDYGYIAQMPGEIRNGSGRPASPQYQVNPAVFSP